MVFRVDRKERLKEIPGYGGKYQVGDLGRVYSRGCELSLVRGRYVNLSGGPGGVQRCDVAYLVARAFLPNAECRPWVVHLDGDKRNNRVENLAWSEEKDGRMARVAGRRSVVQYDLEGNCVGVYGSVKEAEERSGVSAYLIRRSANGTAGRAGKWKFRYV